MSKHNVIEVIDMVRKFSRGRGAGIVSLTLNSYKDSRISLFERRHVLVLGDQGS